MGGSFYLGILKFYFRQSFRPLLIWGLLQELGTGIL